MSHMKHLNHLKIPLRVIKNCTEDFNEKNFIGKGGYGKVYKGILSWAHHRNELVAVKRLDVTWGQGNKEFYTELATLSQYQHANIVSLLGFCDDTEEMILVYQYASRGSLDTYLRDVAMLDKLSWPIRLNICIGVVSALDYLHNRVSKQHRIIHRDIKSANILLDENWNAKLSDFGLSTIGPANQQNTFVVTNVSGTYGYCDPEYERTGILTKESDIYSLGVVLFEVLCGRLVCITKYNDERRFLHHLARTCYQKGKLDNIIDVTIKDQIEPITMKKFSDIAYQCLQEVREERPKIADVALELKNAAGLQVLSSLQKRRIYDHGEESLKAGGFSSMSHDGSSMKFLFNPQNADDIFMEFFSYWVRGMGGLHAGVTDAGEGSASTPPRKGAVIEHPLMCSLEDLFYGSSKKLSLSRDVFDGNGKLTQASEVLCVDIKPGWKKGTKITFVEKGDEEEGVIPSDIVFIIDEKPHAVFKRDGDDLIVTQKISLAEALTGYTAQISTLDGRSLTIPINSVISPTYEKIVQGEGMPISKQPTKKGNLRIQFDIKFPTQLTSKEKSVIKKSLTWT